MGHLRRPPFVGHPLHKPPQFDENSSAIASSEFQNFPHKVLT